MTTSPTNQLHVGDLESTISEPVHLGFGWAGADYLDPEVRAELARLVVARANALGWTYAQLFAWSNSKLARWLLDETGPIGHDAARLVRTYVTLDGLELEG